VPHEPCPGSRDRVGGLQYYLAAGGSIRAEPNGMSSTETQPTDHMAVVAEGRRARKL